MFQHDAAALREHLDGCCDISRTQPVGSNWGRSSWTINLTNTFVSIARILLAHVVANPILHPGEGSLLWSPPRKGGFMYLLERIAPARRTTTVPIFFHPLEHRTWANPMPPANLRGY
jgi:hypothetical protein